MILKPFGLLASPHAFDPCPGLIKHRNTSVELDKCESICFSVLKICQDAIQSPVRVPDCDAANRTKQNDKERWK